CRARAHCISLGAGRPSKGGLGCPRRDHRHAGFQGDATQRHPEGLRERRGSPPMRARGFKGGGRSTPLLRYEAFGSTRKAGTCPPPEVTLASDVPERRVRNPSTSPWKTKGSRSTTRSRNRRSGASSG